MPSAPTSTQAAILNAAERLFAERGFDATSLRAITREAGVNLAAVNYHFRTKVGLFQAVFERRVEAINQERLELLDALERRPGGPPPVREVLEALLAPAVRRLQTNDEGQRLFLRIVGRLQSAAGEHVHVLQEVFSEVQARFLPAFVRALPHLPEADLLWRVHLLLGAMCSVLADPARLEQLTQGRCRPGDAEETLRQLVDFGVAGLEAPPTGGAGTSRKGGG